MRSTGNCSNVSSRSGSAAPTSAPGLGSPAHIRTGNCCTASSRSDRAAYRPKHGVCACARECINVRRCTQDCVCVVARVCVRVRACACVRVRGRNDWAAWWMERRCAAQVYASKDLGSKAAKESQALQALPMAVHTTPCATHLSGTGPPKSVSGQARICTGACG
jgi:hypothetical protein